jgi:hypothetical protein
MRVQSRSLQGQRLWHAVDGWSPEPHCDPCAKQLQHEFSRAAGIVRHVVGQSHTPWPCGSHYPHSCGRHIVGKAAAINRKPVTLGEVDEHGSVTAASEDPPCRRIRFQPSLVKKVSALDAANSILAVENVVRAAILGQDGVSARRSVMPAACLLATRAIANASQDGSPVDLKLDFAAAAWRQGALIRHFASPSICDAAPHAAPAACCIAAQTAATSASSVASAPIDTRAIQRPSRTAGVR